MKGKTNQRGERHMLSDEEILLDFLFEPYLTDHNTTQEMNK